MTPVPDGSVAASVTTQEKKGEKKIKIPPGPTRQSLPLPLSVFASPRAAARVAAGRPRHVPAILNRRATLALRSPLSFPATVFLFSSSSFSRTSRAEPPAATPDSLAAVDSSPPVGLPAIPHVGTSLSLSSSDSDAYPALGLAVQGRRRSPPSAAAHRRGAAASPPLLACITAGEARRLLLFPVRTSPGLLRPCLAAPARAAAAVAARVRAHVAPRRVVAAPLGGSRPLASP